MENEDGRSANAAAESDTDLSIDPTPILGPDGAIARRLPGYESRPEQLEMANAVARAIEEKRHLMVEAGTGVGKSFAYLAPTILAAVKLKKKVVVSTHTIGLQEQLLRKDVPFLRNVMGVDFKALLVKGRGNYVSIRRLDAAYSRSASLFGFDEEAAQIAKLKEWARKSKDGSRADLEFRPSPAVWDAVQSDRGNCLRQKCPTHEMCHYYRARKSVRSAHLLIVNHAMFMSDLAIRTDKGGILPKYDIVVFDEAHTLEAVAGEHLGLRISNSQIEFLLNRLFNSRSQKGLLASFKLARAISLVSETRLASRDFFERILEWQERQRFEERPSPLARAPSRPLDRGAQETGRGHPGRLRWDQRQKPKHRTRRRGWSLRGVCRWNHLLARAKGDRRGFLDRGGRGRAEESVSGSSTFGRRPYAETQALRRHPNVCADFGYPKRWHSAQLSIRQGQNRSQRIEHAPIGKPIQL